MNYARRFSSSFTWSWIYGAPIWPQIQTPGQRIESALNRQLPFSQQLLLDDGLSGSHDQHAFGDQHGAIRIPLHPRLHLISAGGQFLLEFTVLAKAENGSVLPDDFPLLNLGCLSAARPANLQLHLHQ